MSLAKIRQAIEIYLSADTSVAFVSGDGTGQSTPSPAQIGFFMPARPDDVELGSRMTRLNGLYQINLSYPLGEGAGDAEARGDVLMVYLKRGTTLTKDEMVITITDTPQVGRGAADEDRWVVPVTIRWQAWSLTAPAPTPPPVQWNVAASNPNYTFSSDRLTATNATVSGDGVTVIASAQPTADTFYFEIADLADQDFQDVILGLSDGVLTDLTTSQTVGYFPRSWGVANDAGRGVAFNYPFDTPGNSPSPSNGTDTLECNQGDVARFYGKLIGGVWNIWFGVNNTWSGDPEAETDPLFTITSDTLYAVGTTYFPTESFRANFGASSFAYSAPTGAVAYNGSTPQTAVQWDFSDTGGDGSGHVLPILSNGNLSLTTTTPNTGNGFYDSGYVRVRSTVVHSTGKYVFGVRADALPQAVENFALSLGAKGGRLDRAPNADFPSAVANDGFNFWDDGQTYSFAGYVDSGLGSFGPGDWMYIYVDYDAGKAWVQKNDTVYGNPAAGTGAIYTFTPNTELYPMNELYWDRNLGIQYASTVNFGDQPFPHTLAAGFLAYNGLTPTN